MDLNMYWQFFLTDDLKSLNKGFFSLQLYDRSHELKSFFAFKFELRSRP